MKMTIKTQFIVFSHSNQEFFLNCVLFRFTFPWPSWSYGSWIYNYLSVSVTTNIVSSSGEVYSIQHYVLKFVSDLRQVGGFLLVLQFSPPITDWHDISWIFLKVALNTITITHYVPNLDWLFMVFWNLLVYLIFRYTYDDFIFSRK